MYADASHSPTVTSGRAWYAVGVLVVAYIFSIMDRQILTLLVGPIQASLGVNDTMMGLLHGFTFAAFYAIMGLPISRLIDRGHRPVLIAIGIALWSLATAAGGLATEFWHLLVARCGVAVGEAVLIPGAVSLLADLFSPDKRGRAMGVFGAGGPLGAGIGLLAGGLLLGVFTASPPTLPMFGELLPWQATFVAVGLPGLIIAIFMLAVPEPRRMGAARDTPTQGVPVAATVAYLTNHRKTFTAALLGVGFYTLTIYAWAGWTPTYFVRELGWTYPQIGKLLGVIIAIAGPVGVLTATSLADFWRRKGLAYANLRVGALCSAGMAVTSTGMVYAGSPALTMIFLTLAAAFSFSLLGVGPSIIQDTAPAPMRGQVAALYTGTLNIIGAGFGPVAVGVLTDYVLRDPSKIGLAIVLTCVTAGVISILLFLSGTSTYAATKDDAANWRGDGPATSPAAVAP
jgi:MFS family permease